MLIRKNLEGWIKFHSTENFKVSIKVFSSNCVSAERSLTFSPKLSAWSVFIAKNLKVCMTYFTEKIHINLVSWKRYISKTILYTLKYINFLTKHETFLIYCSDSSPGRQKVPSSFLGRTLFFHSYPMFQKITWFINS